MKNTLRFFVGVVLCFCPLVLSAQNSEDDSVSSESADSGSFSLDSLSVNEIIQALKDTIVPLRGDVRMLVNHFTVRVPEGYVFLDAAQTRHLLEDVWGNLPDEYVMGAIIPDSSRLFGSVETAFLLFFDDSGYVKDEDAEEIDYDEMLKELQEEIEEGNKEREEMGLETFSLKGWAETPYYDKENKTLHWAKNLVVDTDDGPYECLNYDIRILGREGYCKWQAVASMKELPQVKDMCGEIINSVRFDEGYAYEDFNPSKDRIAEWTIGGLVAGKVLAKAGIFAKFGAVLAKFWKLVLLGIVALSAFVKKFFLGGNEEKKHSEEVTMNREEEKKEEE